MVDLVGYKCGKFFKVGKSSTVLETVVNARVTLCGYMSAMYSHFGSSSNDDDIFLPYSNIRFVRKVLRLIEGSICRSR